MAVEFTTFRLANFETPLWPVVNFSTGRYNVAGEGVATQYLSLHPLTPWAELLRNEDRRTRERALSLRYPLWVLRVSLPDDPFELSFDSAPEVGLSAEDLVADDYERCHEFADAFRREGHAAFIAPSAALPGTRNLVLLGEKAMVGLEQVPLEDVDIPVALAAQGGRCAEGLWDSVHYRGAGPVHAALEAWHQGREHVFDEPEVTMTTLLEPSHAPL